MELGQLVLKRFLLLVLLLEKAVGGAGMPAGLPLLFRLDAPVKSSAQVGRGECRREHCVMFRESGSILVVLVKSCGQRLGAGGDVQ